MKYIISLLFAGLLASTITAQNNPILDEVPVVIASVEDMAKEISYREEALVENTVNDYSLSIWSRDIYRQVGANVYGNESLFLPAVSDNQNTNLFSFIVELIASGKVKAYGYTQFANLNDTVALPNPKEALAELVIPCTDNGDGTVSVKKSDIPTDRIEYYLVKEKWYFDTKTGKGDIRVEAIAPVLLEKGTYYPMCWLSFDALSPYLARVESLVKVDHIAPPLTNVSIFDIVKNRYYRGCIYQVGFRQLYTQFPEMNDLIKERKRIENELDYIQSRFYAAQRRR